MPDERGEGVKAPGKKREFPPSADAWADRGTDRQKMIPTPEPPSVFGAEKLMPEEQKRRFIEEGREAERSENGADFDAALKRMAQPNGDTA